MFRRKRTVVLLVFGAALVLVLLAALVIELPSLAAGGFLHPIRQRLGPQQPAACEDALFGGAGIVLSGWRCRTGSHRRGVIVHLHGVADNRAALPESSAGCPSGSVSQAP